MRSACLDSDGASLIDWTTSTNNSLVDIWIMSFARLFTTNCLHSYRSIPKTGYTKTRNLHRTTAEFTHRKPNGQLPTKRISGSVIVVMRLWWFLSRLGMFFGLLCWTCLMVEMRVRVRVPGRVQRRIEYRWCFTMISGICSRWPLSLTSIWSFDWYVV